MKELTALVLRLAETVDAILPALEAAQLGAEAAKTVVVALEARIKSGEALLERIQQLAVPEKDELVTTAPRPKTDLLSVLMQIGPTPKLELVIMDGVGYLRPVAKGYSGDRVFACYGTPEATKEAIETVLRESAWYHEMPYRWAAVCEAP